MTKYLRIKSDHMKYLKRKAIPDMIFGSPNDVLRYILELPSKRDFEQSNKNEIKIRVDDEVLEKLEARAKQLNVGIGSLHELLEKILRLKDEDEDKEGKQLIGGEEIVRRPGGRPTTR